MRGERGSIIPPKIDFKYFWEKEVPAMPISKDLTKNHIMEIQVNGGDIAAKIKWAKAHFEQEINVADVSADIECIDNKGNFNGRITNFAEEVDTGVPRTKG